MTLLRYLSRLFLARFALAFAGLVALLQLLDLLDRASTVLSKGTVADLVHYAGMRLPTVAAGVLPLAALVASLLLCTRLAGTLEAAALRAAGVGTRGMLARLLPACLVLAALQGALTVYAAPRAERALADWWAARGGEPDPAARATRRLWLRAGTDVVAVERVAPGGARLEGVMLVRRDPAGHALARVDARAAEWTSGGWVLRDATLVHAGGDRAEHAASLPWPGGPSPENMAALTRPPEALAPLTLLAALRGEWAVQRGPAWVRTRLHAAAARPVAPLVMLLLALPAVLVVPRGGGSPATAALGFVLGVLYLFTGGLLGALGEAGLLPPALAAWAAPVGFAAAGAVRLVRAEED